MAFGTILCADIPTMGAVGSELYHEKECLDYKNTTAISWE